MGVKHNKQVGEVLQQAQKEIYELTGILVRLDVVKIKRDRKYMSANMPYTNDIDDINERVRDLISWDSMAEIIAKALGMSLEDYGKKTRKREYVELRFIATYIARNWYPLVYLRHLQELFGGQDHTTIMSGGTSADTLLTTRDLVFCTKWAIVVNSVNKIVEDILGSRAKLLYLDTLPEKMISKAQAELIAEVAFGRAQYYGNGKIGNLIHWGKEYKIKWPNRSRNQLMEAMRTQLGMEIQ